MAGATDQLGAQALAERLRDRREEIEQTLLTRVYAVEDPGEVGDAEYAAGLRAAVSAALEYGFSALAGANAREPIPSELLVQARQAARNGVGLDTVLRRYLSGYTLLEDCILGEVGADGGGILEGDLRRLARARAQTFDRLIEAITAEYRLAAEEHILLARQRRVECVERLLAGELVEESELGYPLAEWHLGLVASGRRAETAIRELAGSLERRALVLGRGEGVAWAWLGGRRRLCPGEVAEHLESESFEGLSVAIGEAARGKSGWRLTHRQALAALPIAIRGGPRLVRYSDVCLLALGLRDEVLARSLQELYIAPLEKYRGGGEVLRQTLRTYFRLGENVSSTAAALNVTRQTVAKRLGTVERELGRSLDSCGREMGLALELEELSVNQ